VNLGSTARPAEHHAFAGTPWHGFGIVFCFGSAMTVMCVVRG
jgi:hypothetical protein